MHRSAKRWLTLTLMLGSMWAGTAGHAQANPRVGNRRMRHDSTVVTNVAASPIHTKLTTAIQSAELAETLSGKGPFTLFAPTDDAFAKLPSGAASTLMAPENKQQLTKVLTYHVVAGKFTSGKLLKRVKKGKGTLTLKTLEGDNLTVKRAGSILMLTDTKNGTAFITTPDVKSKNGVTHVIDAVLMPN